MPPNRPPTTSWRASPMSMTATTASAWSAKHAAIIARPPTTTAKPSLSFATTQTAMPPSSRPSSKSSSTGSKARRTPPWLSQPARPLLQPRRVLGGVKASTPAARSLLDPACAPGGHVCRSAPRNGPSVSPRNTSEKAPLGAFGEGAAHGPIKFRDQKPPKTRRFARSGSFFAPVDSALLHALQNPRVNIAGVRRSELLPDLGMLSPTRLSRQLRRLLDLGVIKRVTGTYRYYLTKAGRAATAAAERITEAVVVPAMI